MFTGILADFGQFAISLFAGVSLVIVANAALYRIFQQCEAAGRVGESSLRCVIRHSTSMTAK